MIGSPRPRSRFNREVGESYTSWPFFKKWSWLTMCSFLVYSKVIQISVCISICMYSFSDYFPLYGITRYWIYFPVLYGKSLLFTYLIFKKYFFGCTWNLHFIMQDLLLLRIDSLVVACELSCFMECGIIPDHGLKWCPSTARRILNHWTTLRKETSFSWQPALDTTTPGFWQHLEKTEGKRKIFCLEKSHWDRRFHFLID